MSKPLKVQFKGSLIVRRGGRFYKVMKTRYMEGNWWTFECKDVDSMEDVFFDFEMLGLFEALGAAASTMKYSKDILFMDLDNKGKWKILTKDQVNKALKR